MRPRHHLGGPPRPVAPHVPRAQDLDHPSSSSAWMEPRCKEAATHCALLQEHAQRCFVRGEQDYHAGKDGTLGWNYRLGDWKDSYRGDPHDPFCFH